MGKVFSVEEINNAPETIPSAADFEAAISNFEEAVNREVDQGALSGAMIYGSVAIRAYSLRSDFDCLITPYEHSLDSQAAIDRVITATNPSGKIDVSSITHSKTRLASGMHEIDRYFGNHLTGDSRLVFGEDSADYMRFPDYGPYIHLISYIRHKKRSVATAFSPDAKEHHKGLQKILELPLAVGRKTLRALDELEGTHFATSDSANKERITPASMELFDTLGLANTPQSLIELSQHYNLALSNVLSGELSQQEYEVVLKRIATAGIDATNWLDKLDTVITDRYN